MWTQKEIDLIEDTQKEIVDTEFQNIKELECDKVSNLNILIDVGSEQLMLLSIDNSWWMSSLTPSDGSLEASPGNSQGS